MQTNDMSTGIGVQISGTFDIAIVRQHIRKLSQELRWPPELCMRGIAAMTALAETIYFRDRLRQGPLVVYIHVMHQDGVNGLELHADADFAAIAKDFTLARWNLERVCNELKIIREQNYDHIVLRVWSNGRR
jgi:hypothetical protein